MRPDGIEEFLATNGPKPNWEKLNTLENGAENKVLSEAQAELADPLYKQRWVRIRRTRANTRDQG